MNQISTTKMSSKGQVVIPEQIRNQLNLKTGSQFVVLGQGDFVILKIIEPPTMNELKTVLAKARKQAKNAKLKSKDIKEAIKQARSSSQ